MASSQVDIQISDNPNAVMLPVPRVHCRLCCTYETQNRNFECHTAKQTCLVAGEPHNEGMASLALSLYLAPLASFFCPVGWTPGYLLSTQPVCALYGWREVGGRKSRSTPWFGTFPCALLSVSCCWQHITRVPGVNLIRQVHE